MSPTLVILAAGAGSRYGGLKQLAPIGPGGETLLEYSAFDAVRAGFGRIVLVVRSETERAFRELLDSRMARRVPVAYVHQRVDNRSSRRVKPWGTAHAVLAAAAEVDGPFAVVNADDFYGAESYVTLSGFLTGPAFRWPPSGVTKVGRVLAAVGFHVADTLPEAGAVSRALLEVDGDGWLRGIVEIFEVWRQDGGIACRDGEGHERALAGDQLVSMNMWGLTPRVMPELRRRFADFLARPGREPGAEYILPEVIQSMVRDGSFRVEVLAGSDGWCGITRRQDEEHSRSVIVSLVGQGRYPRELWT